MSHAPSEIDDLFDFGDEPLELLEREGLEPRPHLPELPHGVRRAPPPPDPFLRRFTTILVAGLVMIGLAVLARTLLDAAAPLPAGIVEHRALPAAAGEGATVARYEWEREQVAR